MEDQVRRLKRAIVALTMILILFAGGFVFWVSAQVTRTNKSIDLIQANLDKPVEKIQTIQGEQGLMGMRGEDGADGKDSVSTNTIVQQPTYIQQNIPVPGEKGEQGLKGETGKPGREVEIAQDLLGNIYQRYEGDEYWQPIIKLEVAL